MHNDSLLNFCTHLITEEVGTSLTSNTLLMQLKQKINGKTFNQLGLRIFIDIIVAVFVATSTTIKETYNNLYYK